MAPRPSSLVLSAFLLAAGPGFAQSDDDPFGEPAMARETDVDQVEGGFEDPDDMVTGSGQLGNHEAGFESPDSRVVGAERIGNHEAGYEDPTAMPGHSDDLANLPMESGNAEALHPAPTLVAAPTAPGPNATSETRALWRELQSAEASLQASEGTYANMINRNYPTGERRQQIIDERNAAVDAVNQARTRYAEASGN